MNFSTNPESFSEGYILFTVARSMENRLPQGNNQIINELDHLTEALWERAFIFIIQQKIQAGQLKMSDLENECIAKIAEIYLGELYPQLDLKADPADHLLNDGCYAKEVASSLAALLQAPNFTPEPSYEDDPETARLQQELAQLYPHLNLDADAIADELIETWGDEIERRIVDLSSVPSGLEATHMQN